MNISRVISSNSSKIISDDSYKPLVANDLLYNSVIMSCTNGAYSSTRLYRSSSPVPTRLATTQLLDSPISAKNRYYGHIAIRARFYDSAVRQACKLSKEYYCYLVSVHNRCCS
jgi:hypothetical protein